MLVRLKLAGVLTPPTEAADRVAARHGVGGDGFGNLAGMLRGADDRGTAVAERAAVHAARGVEGDAGVGHDIAERVHNRRHQRSVNAVLTVALFRRPKWSR